jgi:hypothetical protein
LVTRKQENHLFEHKSLVVSENSLMIFPIALLHVRHLCKSWIHGGENIPNRSPGFTNTQYKVAMDSSPCGSYTVLSGAWFQKEPSILVLFDFIVFMKPPVWSWDWFFWILKYLWLWSFSQRILIQSSDFRLCSIPYPYYTCN